MKRWPAKNPCGAPNPQGNYHCNLERGHDGDHIHRFWDTIDDEWDFYYWPSAHPSAESEREGK